MCFEHASAEVNRGRQYLLLNPLTELLKWRRFQWPGFQWVPAFSLAGSSQALILPAKELPQALISRESAVVRCFSVQLCNFSNTCEAWLWNALVFLLVQLSSHRQSDVGVQMPRGAVPLSPCPWEVTGCHDCLSWGKDRHPGMPTSLLQLWIKTSGTLGTVENVFSLRRSDRLNASTRF